MKKMLISMSAFFGLLLFTAALTAQTDMVWDTHGVGFKVPDDFVITTNHAEEFTANNDNLFLTIAPIQDETITEEDLADAVVAMAEEMDFNQIDEGDAIEVDDFVGYYVKGRSEGANAVVMALLDKESSTNLLVVLAYNDGYEMQAVKVIASLYAYD